MTSSADPSEQGDLWAAVYDEVYAGVDDADDVVERLAHHRPADRAGRLLELGVGTGRLALPLAVSGWTVTGVDASAQMLSVLSRKDPDDLVTRQHGDMSALTWSTEDAFDVVLIAFNTLFSLIDQDQQVACIAEASRVLAPDGVLVVEAAVPQPWATGTSTSEPGQARVVIETTDHDPVGQTLRMARVVVSDTLGVVPLPLVMRYAWPSEIDLMARLAGLRCTGRVGGWDGRAFERSSTQHVSTYAHEP